jgi:hypothetical protein
MDSSLKPNHHKQISPCQICKTLCIIQMKFDSQTCNQNPRILKKIKFILKIRKVSFNSYFKITKTGTDLHIDPDVTDAWNGLISGSKWWAYLPKDLYESKTDWNCDKSCSDFDDTDLFHSALWFYNMLPQMRLDFSQVKKSEEYRAAVSNRISLLATCPFLDT